MIPTHTQTQDVSDLTRELALEFNSASDDVLNHAIERAFSAFCEQSHFWHVELDPITIEDGVINYDLSYGANFIILDVKKVEVPDGEVKQNAKDMGIYARWTQRSMDSIDLYSIDVADVVTVTVSVKPRLYNSIFYYSVQVLSDYRDTILDGARAFLFRLPGKEWTDLQQFQYLDTKFNRTCDKARLRQADSFSRLGNRVAENRRLFY